MSLSTPAVESKTQFSPLPQDIEEHHVEINDGNIVRVEPCEEEHLDWDGAVIFLRLIMTSMLLIGLALHQRKLYQSTFDPIPPKFFLDSFEVPHLEVSEGEVSSTWVMNVTIWNVMNFSDINIINLEARISYEENETLAVITPIMPQYVLSKEVSLLENGATKKVHLNLSTTGWEENQPIVDDTVVQAIDEDMQRGTTRFSLHMIIIGEVSLGNGWVQTFTMHPKCTDLVVKVVPGNTTTITHHRPKECVGLVQWEHIENTF